MSESIQLRDPLFKLYLRFSNGEVVNHIATNPIEPRAITADMRYAVIACYSTQNPSECTDITVVNLRDVTYIKTERVTVDQLVADRRMAGIRSSDSNADDRLPKALAQITFV
jgi:hypothetical protein